MSVCTGVHGTYSTLTQVTHQTVLCCTICFCFLFIFLSGPSGLLVVKIHMSKVKRYVSRRVRVAYCVCPEELCESKYRRDEDSAALG